MFFTDFCCMVSEYCVLHSSHLYVPRLAKCFPEFLICLLPFHGTHALSVTSPCFSPLQLHYIHSSPSGSGSANPPVVSTVYAYIGTPPAQRQQSSLVWRLGPTHFLEEVLPASGISTIYELGPNYVGSFQAVYVPCKYKPNVS